MIKTTTLLVIVLAAAMVNADMYLHYPPGSNDRNRERNENRNNGNRLFDSQNNDKGGYPWRGDPTVKGAPDALTYYTGSVMRIEWTNQHSCGMNPNLDCTVILQVGCDDASKNLKSTQVTADPVCADGSCRQFPGLRDGYPTADTFTTNDVKYRQRNFASAGQNSAGTNQIPSNVDNPNFYNNGAQVDAEIGTEYGMHENRAIYDACRQTERNKGLYVADQTLTGAGATATRQNPNGNRRGLECPEERDYFPYWNSKINRWRDVAVLTNQPGKCQYFQDNSANVVKYGYCEKVTPGAPPNGGLPIQRQACETLGTAYAWRTGYCTTLDCATKPDCVVHAYGRDNHLGNSYQVDPSTGDIRKSETGEPEMAHYNWNVPTELAGQMCTLRVRYNMTSLDYESDAYAKADREPYSIGIDSSKNCPRVTNNPTPPSTCSDNGGIDCDNSVAANNGCFNTLVNNNRPLYNRPFVDYLGSGKPRVSIAINTNQNGRTFQDRSYVFNVAANPVGETIYNLNVRGRRGNIVQAYPAVEYDFVPSHLTVEGGTYVHVQFHGSDFNTNRNRNNGEGNQFTDRFNMIELDDKAHNIMPHISSLRLFDSTTRAEAWAMLGQDYTKCLAIEYDDANQDNTYENCGKLNMAPNRYPTNPEAGLLLAGSALVPGGGTVHYVSTRNNNLSNRSQKGTITVSVKKGLSSAEIAGIVVGTFAFIGIVIALLVLYALKYPYTRIGKCYSDSRDRCRGQKSALGNTRQHASAETMGAPPNMTYSRAPPPATQSPPNMTYTRHA